MRCVITCAGGFVGSSEREAENGLELLAFESVGEEEDDELEAIAIEEVLGSLLEESPEVSRPISKGTDKSFAVTGFLPFAGIVAIGAPHRRQDGLQQCHADGGHEHDFAMAMVKTGHQILQGKVVKPRALLKDVHVSYNRRSSPLPNHRRRNRQHTSEGRHGRNAPAAYCAIFEEHRSRAAALRRSMLGGKVVFGGLDHFG